MDRAQTIEHVEAALTAVHDIVSAPSLAMRVGDWDHLANLVESLSVTIKRRHAVAKQLYDAGLRPAPQFPQFATPASAGPTPSSLTTPTTTITTTIEPSPNVSPAMLPAKPPQVPLVRVGGPPATTTHMPGPAPTGASIVPPAVAVLNTLTPLLHQDATALRKMPAAANVAGGGVPSPAKEPNGASTTQVPAGVRPPNVRMGSAGGNAPKPPSKPVRLPAFTATTTSSVMTTSTSAPAAVAASNLNPVGGPAGPRTSNKAQGAPVRRPASAMTGAAPLDTKFGLGVLRDPIKPSAASRTIPAAIGLSGPCRTPDSFMEMQKHWANSTDPTSPLSLNAVEDAILPLEVVESLVNDKDSERDLPAWEFDEKKFAAADTFWKVPRGPTFEDRAFGL